jgi:hypothetical protein
MQPACAWQGSVWRVGFRRPPAQVLLIGGFVHPQLVHPQQPVGDAKVWLGLSLKADA